MCKLMPPIIICIIGLIKYSLDKISKLSLAFEDLLSAMLAIKLVSIFFILESCSFLKLLVQITLLRFVVIERELKGSEVLLLVSSLLIGSTKSCLSRVDLLLLGISWRIFFGLKPVFSLLLFLIGHLFCFDAESICSFLLLLSLLLEILENGGGVVGAGLGESVLPYQFLVLESEVSHNKWS